MVGQVLLAARTETVLSWRAGLAQASCTLLLVSDAAAARAALASRRFDVFILEPAPEVDLDRTLLEEARRIDPSLYAVLVGAMPSYELAMQAIQDKSLYRVLPRSSRAEALELTLRGALDARSRAGLLVDDVACAPWLAAASGCLQQAS